MNLWSSSGGLFEDLFDIVTAPIKMVTDAAQIVTHPIKELADEAVEIVKDIKEDIIS